MANVQAFESGYNQGYGAMEHRRARKQALSDAQFQEKHNEIQGMIDNLQTQAAAIPDKKSDDYTKVKTQLDQALQERDAHWRSLEHPNAIMRFGKMLGKDMHFPQKAAPDYAASAGKEADQLLAAGPLTPEQQAGVGVRGKLAEFNANLKAQTDIWDNLHKGASQEEKDTAHSEIGQRLMQTMFGLTGKGHWKQVTGKIYDKPATLNYDSDLNRYTYQTGESVPQEALDTWVPDVKPSGTIASLEMDQYNKAVAGGYKGTYLQWRTEQTAGNKPKNADEEFRILLKKKDLGEPLSKDDIATMRAYQEWINVKTTQPKVAGYQALAWSRIVPAVVPGRPGETQYVPAGIAYKNNMKAPSSLSHLMTIYYGTGKGGQDLLRFNTATHHLKLMAQLADNLDNTQSPVYNRLKNEWTTQLLGGEAPTDFNGIRDAVAGELSRLYTGVGATNEELENIKSTVNNAQSPEQLAGIISTSLATMHGKIEASAQQYISGTEGIPAFPEDVVPPPPQGANPPPNPNNPLAGRATNPQAQTKSKGARSLAAAMALPINKGKSAAEVEKHLKDLGYTVTRP
jgi:hypothetical protein